MSLTEIPGKYFSWKDFIQTNNMTWFPNKEDYTKFNTIIIPNKNPPLVINKQLKLMYSNTNVHVYSVSEDSPFIKRTKKREQRKKRKLRKQREQKERLRDNK